VVGLALENIFQDRNCRSVQSYLRGLSVGLEDQVRADKSGTSCAKEHVGDHLFCKEHFGDHIFCARD
jgi:hypothetical protein